MLASWLKCEAGKPRFRRRSLKGLYAAGVTQSIIGSYDHVATFAREWCAERQRLEDTAVRVAFVLLASRAVHAFQFDCSEGGGRTKSWTIEEIVHGFLRSADAGCDPLFQA